MLIQFIVLNIFLILGGCVIMLNNYFIDKHQEYYVIKKNQKIVAVMLRGSDGDTVQDIMALDAITKILNKRYKNLKNKK